MKFALLLLLSCLSQAKEPALPYLGPGSDKLSPEQYEKVYRNYIQTSILLGYPFLKEEAPACEHALSTIFRQAGMFAYPVPAEAERVNVSKRKTASQSMETYESAGMIVQVVREKNNALNQVIWINSGSPKASRRLAQVAKKEVLTLERDPVTGLERVKGIPVGFPHALLTPQGQGLFVKILQFNKKIDGCEPIEFTDDSWIGGFDLSESRCLELQRSAQGVWEGRLNTVAFASQELKKLQEKALANALARGTKEEDAKRLVAKHFVPPFTSEINVIGTAMRNLAQCNLLALGRAGGTRPGAPATPPAGGTPKSGSGR